MKNQTEFLGQCFRKQPLQIDSKGCVGRNFHNTHNIWILPYLIASAAHYVHTCACMYVHSINVYSILAYTPSPPNAPLSLI